ncbi:MAG: aminopeptidase P family protein [Pseudomonadota bacterium]|nr:aminopeptidase P family protein [Pseudomonadota bacterium]
MSLPDIHSRVAALRQEMGRLGLDGLVIPHSDEYQNEYLPPHAERLAWATGFTGSAGMAILLQGRAGVFVDGRYTLQVRDQAPADLFSFADLTETGIAAWLDQAFPASGTLGYDPALHTVPEVARLGQAVARKGGMMRSCRPHPVDACWMDRPTPAPEPFEVHPLSFAGRNAAGKRIDLAAELSRAGLDATVMTEPQSMAWLLNIRGRDVPHTPLPLSCGILHADSTVDLFTDPAKVTDEVAAWLGNAVRVSSTEKFPEALKGLGTRKAKVRVDVQSAPALVVETLRNAGVRLDEGPDPSVLPRACKNDTELEGARNAHRRDGVALVRFLHWLSETWPRRTVTELEAMDRLLEFRQQGELFRDTSFATIAGAGPNGAIVHYHSTPATSRPLESGTLFLLDSGAQYRDGTTDVTRTVALGPPTAEMRDRFTRVLKGHIAIAMARFPAGTTGPQLDALARAPLWAAGLDYDHGTGHGVGSYLSVHEGPQRISKRGGGVPLQPGMIVSNEPGYYKASAWGIRIESLVAVRPCKDIAGAERDMLEFETLTLAPIDMTLVDRVMLSTAETAWLDAYHRRVRDILLPLLPADAAVWIQKSVASSQ